MAFARVTTTSSVSSRAQPGLTRSNARSGSLSADRRPRAREIAPGVRLLPKVNGNLMKIRNSARVIVINPRSEFVLLKYEDRAPVDPAQPDLLSYWVPPGGGVDDHESFEEAAGRELEEETGIDEIDLGPCIWTRDHRLFHAGVLKHHHERYFVAWTTSTRALRNRTAEEIREIRWWSLPALSSSKDVFLPPGLATLVAPLLAGELPSFPHCIECS
jgi:8-oxo-dGTP pyrophosphatase MutT (NUDIX family)